MIRSMSVTAGLATAAFLILTIGAAPTVAEDRNTDGEHCVSLNRIDRTEVVDDRRILFYMLGDEIYLNRLPHPCPGLGFEESFMYRTSLNQLCDLDIITVLDDIGFGFHPGVSCGLGMFHPVSEDEAEQLLEKEDD